MHSQAVLEQGVIPRLVQLLSGDDKELKLNALWAFKNLLYKATADLKREVMSAIGWSEINRWEAVECSDTTRELTTRSLLLNSDPRLREQVFHILRHIADGVDDVDFLFSEMGGSDELLGSLAKAMESENEDVVLQVCPMTPC